MKPLLQIALDQSRLDKALEVADIAAPNVDIIEAGTILCLAEGRKAVETLRERYPNHILVADYKTADAGSTLAEIAFDAGADWFTVMCAASLATIEKAHEVAVARGKEVQIELFGNWTLEDAKAWANMGVKQAIYHRSRDAQASGQKWGEKDLNLLRELSAIGLELSITGGIVPEEIGIFKDINAKCFIAGRALADKETGAATAKAFHASIDEYWRD
ncbi:3-keto-L-gulonate-6-phosphate decarboxylase UlaD [Suttonella ornithocola]|uniref:3-keto-L-gulonate-6-phosphate decarboxylase sgbH n=1 Tax=Suttonella ornithocola TaxID=279832 RepID=A0A380MNH8_9GAMM|nr:3-keto-L-gulonate-6-phosphate decarboxylase UlaD [Suttonella ornithocola]SUO93586.1 3-keto-L-gulonate-6-phosphate decarboxylase sgbH [Suttonella ornithocola]